MGGEFRAQPDLLDDAIFGIQARVLQFAPALVHRHQHFGVSHEQRRHRLTSRLELYVSCCCLTPFSHSALRASFTLTRFGPPARSRLTRLTSLGRRSPPRSARPDRARACSLRASVISPRLPSSSCRTD